MEIFSLMGTIAISKEKALKDIKAVQEQAQKASTAMGKSFTKFSGYVEKHSAQIKKAGKYMTVFGGIATAAFAISVKSAANFETQLANVSTMLDESAMKILPEYRRELQSLSVDFGESTETLSKGLYDILSASIPPAEALGVLEVSAKAAAAGITDTGVAADAITTILNSYGMSADQAGMVSDKLFAVVKEGKTTFAELAPSIGKVAATASMAGLSFDDLGACIATMTRAGIRTEETMTAINGVLIAFLKPTDEAIEAAAKFGLELNTTTLQTLGMTGVMEKLTDATAEQLAAIFPNIRGLKGMAAALGDAEGYAKSYALMLDSAGLTQEAFEKQSATLNFTLKQLKSMFEILKVTIGDALAPVVKDITEKVMEALKGFKEWADAHKPLVEILVKVGAGVGVLMLILGPLLVILPSLVSGITLLATVSLPALAAAFAPFLIGGVIIAGLIKMSKLFGDIKKRAFEMHTGFKEMGLSDLEALISKTEKTIAGLEAELEEVIKPFKLLGIEITRQDVNVGRLRQVIEDCKKELGWFEEELKILIETLGITGTGIKQVDEFAQSFADKMLMMEIAAKSFVVANKNLRTFMEPVRKIIEGIIAALTPYEQKIIAVNAKYDEMIETIKESGAAQEDITAAVEDANIARDETLKLLADEKTAYDKLVEIQKTAKDIMAGIVDKIFEFIRSPYDVKLRDINREYDSHIEKIKEAKLGIEEEKEEIDKINYARELAIKNLNAEIDATKGLSLEMQILTAEYKLSEQTAEDTIKYYQDMLEAAKEIVEVKKAEREVLEEGTEEWKEANLVYLEAQNVVKGLEETIDELNQVMNEELEGLELIRAKLDLQSKQYEVTGKNADYYKERIELLGEEHGELAEAIAELEERGEEWSGELVKLKGELAGNETATEKLKEELIELAKGMSEAELEASGLIPILEALGITMEDLKPPDISPWEDFFESLRSEALTTTEVLVEGAKIIWEAFKDALSGVVHSLLTMAKTNAKIKEEMAEAEAEHLKEMAELHEDYDEMIAEHSEERAKAEKDYHDEATEAEKDHLEEVTELQQDYQQMILDGIEELAREKEDYYDNLAELERRYNRKVSDGIKDLARENEDYDIEMRRLKEEYYIAVLEGDDKTAKKYKENIEDCTLAHSRAVEDMEEKQGELTEDHGIKMDKMEENHKNAMDAMIKKQGEEAQNALDKIAEVEADHEELIAKMEEEHKLAMDAMIEKHDEEAANALENIEDVKEDHADLMEDMQDDLVTTQSIAETFWEALKKAAIDALTDMIVKQVISAFVSFCSSIPFGWVVLLAGIAAAIALAYSLAAKEFGGEVIKQAMAFGGRVAKFAGGGLIKGLQLGGRGTDTVPTMLTPGEYVISKPMTDFIKRTGIVTDDLVNAIRIGSRTPTPSFAVGGAVPSIVSNPISNQVNIEEISVSIFAQELNDETISNAGDKMFVELKRQFDMRGLVLMEV